MEKIRCLSIRVAHFKPVKRVNGTALFRLITELPAATLLFAYLISAAGSFAVTSGRTTDYVGSFAVTSGKTTDYVGSFAVTSGRTTDYVGDLVKSCEEAVRPFAERLPSVSIDICHLLTF
jgi:hypothetical protein